MKFKFTLIFLFCFSIHLIFAQANGADRGMVLPDSAKIPEVRAENERIFSKYMYAGHGGVQGLADFKKNNEDLYYKELWYFSMSFYILRDYRKEGVPMDKASFAIHRYESYRKPSEESVVVLPGYRDALVLLPSDKLIYKP